MTARELIANEYQYRASVCAPLGLLAVNTHENAVAGWDDRLGRWCVVAGTTIMPGEPWVVMDHELLINGQPIPETWTLIPPR